MHIILCLCHFDQNIHFRITVTQLFQLLETCLCPHSFVFPWAVESSPLQFLMFRVLMYRVDGQLLETTFVPRLSNYVTLTGSFNEIKENIIHKTVNGLYVCYKGPHFGPAFSHSPRAASTSLN